MEIPNLPTLPSPPVLFLLLNSVILAIAIVSFRRSKPSSSLAASTPPLLRASSSNVLERFRSGLFRFRSGELIPPPATESLDHEITADPTDQTYRRVQSQSETIVKGGKVKKMKKTVSEKRPVQIRRQVSVDEEVDAKADDFINRFRQQLKLQKSDSVFK